MVVWDHLDYLMGRSLKTLEDQQPFEILEKSSADIQIFVYSSRETRRLKRGILEGAWLQLTRHGVITEEEIKSNHSASNYPYIIAILGTMPTVNYSPNPAKLTTTAIHDDDS